MNSIDTRELARLRSAIARDFTPRYDERVTISAGGLETLIAQRLYDLRFQLIDRVAVAAPATPAQLQRIAARLAPFGYRPVTEDHAQASGGEAALCLASPRLTEPQVDTFRDAAGRAATLARLGIQCRGVIQVGAHVGQEVPLFKALGARRLILVEANPAVYRTLQANVTRLGVDALLANCAIADFDGETELHLASFDQSSSLLPLAHHSVEYPQIRAVGTVRVPARRLDTLVQREFGADPRDFNVLEIDVQGAEGLVLRGAPDQLAQVDAVYVEINYKPMYQGCLLIDAIDALLLDAGLIRIEQNCAHSPNWGDALYVRRPRTVSMSNLGRNGRLGNQVLQYAWLAGLCAEHGLQAQVPACDLGRLFDLDAVQRPAAARPAATTLPAAATLPVASATPPAALSEQALLSRTPFSSQTAVSAQGNDVSGYFQFHTALWRSRQDTLRGVLPLSAPNAALEQRIATLFAERGRCLAIHYRQSDFNQFPGSRVFYIAPLDWYASALRDLAGGPQADFVYLASDSPLDLGPLAATRLPVLRQADLLQALRGDKSLQALTSDDPPDAVTLDFLALKVADALLISNSTFSFAAALLNTRCRLFLRPDIDAGRLRPFDPWHSPVLLGLEDDAVRFAR